MISPHTPRGTKVVCIESDTTYQMLVEGRVYHVADIRPSSANPDGFGVTLEEGPHVNPIFGTEIGWLLSRFRYLELPKAWKDMMTSALIDAEKKIERIEEMV